MRRDIVYGVVILVILLVYGRQTRRNVKAIVWQGPERMEIGERPEPRRIPADMRWSCARARSGYAARRSRATSVTWATAPRRWSWATSSPARSSPPARAPSAGSAHARPVNPIRGCGRCPLCRSGQENICPERTLIGVHFDGAFADLVRAPAENLRVLPDELDIRVGALTEPLANGVHAVRLGLAGFDVRLCRGDRRGHNRRWSRFRPRC